MIITHTTHLLKLPEVAAELHVGETKVQDWVYANELGSFKKGFVRRVSLQDLTRFVLLHTLSARRPDWLTAAVESEFKKMLREMVQQEAASAVAKAMADRAAQNERIAA